VSRLLWGKKVVILQFIEQREARASKKRSLLQLMAWKKRNKSNNRGNKYERDERKSC
jgi:hypothetical protein